MFICKKSGGKKFFLVIFLVILLLAGVYFVFNPADGFFPPCLFYKFTGYLCPGCGSQRAIHSLLHLDLKNTFYHNPIFLPALVVVFLLVYLQYFGGKRRFPKLNRILAGTKFIFVTLIVIVLFWIGRNIMSHAV